MAVRRGSGDGLGPTPRLVTRSASTAAILAGLLTCVVPADTLVVPPSLPVLARYFGVLPPSFLPPVSVFPAVDSWKLQNKTKQHKNEPWISVDGYFNDQEFGGDGDEGCPGVNCNSGLEIPMTHPAPRRGVSSRDLEVCQRFNAYECFYSNAYASA